MDSLRGEVIFTPEYRSADAVRGLEAFSHIWLIWEFSENVRADWSPTVRPPRLGGNVRMGVFATRSPFRPNRSVCRACVWRTLHFPTRAARCSMSPGRI